MCGDVFDKTFFFVLRTDKFYKVDGSTELVGSARCFQLKDSKIWYPPKKPAFVEPLQTTSTISRTVSRYRYYQPFSATIQDQAWWIFTIIRRWFNYCHSVVVGSPSAQKAMNSILNDDP